MKTKKFTKGLVLRVFSTIIISVFAVVFLMPVIATITNSFMTSAEITARYMGNNRIDYNGIPSSLGIIPFPFTLSQYWNVLIKEYRYLFMFWNSVLVTVVATFFHTIFSLLTGYAVGRISFRFKKLFLFLLVVVLFLPFSVTLLPNYIIVRTLNLYDTYWALILPAVFAPLGFLMIAGFSKELDSECIEAALLETNSYFVVMLKIVIPLLRPAIAALVLVTFAENWNMVEQPLVLMEDALKYPLSIALRNFADLASAFAGSVIYLIPIFVLFLFFENEMLQQILNFGGRINE